VGQRFIQLLEDHPFFELTVIVASEQNKNKFYRNAVNWLIEEDIPSYVKNLKISSFDLKLLKKKGIKVVFSALPPDIAKKKEKILADNGFAVFSNSRAHRYNKEIPILIPEVNPDHIKLVDLQLRSNKGFIITNANCSTTGLALVLKPLLKFNIQNVFVSTYQALSGAGYPGVASLSINSNVVPYINGEEEKIEFETKKILGKYDFDRILRNGIKIVSSCARVPVRDGHLESVVIEFEEEVDLPSIKSAFNNFSWDNGLPTSPEKPIVLRDEADRPQPWKDAYAGHPNRAKGMSVTVGRLKKQGRWIRFWLVVHNTIRGAAGNSILNAEYALKNGYLNGVI
jgi:aspartate-semialdehyde dehydrogenase